MRSGVRRVLEHYEGQSAADAAAEDDAAFAERGQTVMVIPNELVVAVQTLLAEYGGKFGHPPSPAPGSVGLGSWR